MTRPSIFAGTIAARPGAVNIPRRGAAGLAGDGGRGRGNRAGREARHIGRGRSAPTSHPRSPGSAMLQRRSLSPDVRAEMRALGLLAPRRPLVLSLVLSVGFVDVAAAVLSLIGP